MQASHQLAQFAGQRLLSGALAAVAATAWPARRTLDAVRSTEHSL
jgi:hypothetical protein